jgi:hypothetical protein
LTLVPLQPKKLSRRAQAFRRLRRPDGCFLPVPKAVQREPVDWNALYQFRDDWRAYRKLEAAAKREEKIGSFRSICLFAAMSAIMVGFLMMGVWHA